MICFHGVKSYKPFIQTIVSLVAVCVNAQSSTNNLAELTPDQAERIVEAQIAARATKELERKQRILGVEAELETIHHQSAYNLILRKVEWQPIEPVNHSEMKAQSELISDLGLSQVNLEDYQHSMISFSATVYDDTYTQVIWRSAEQASEPIVLWLNINFKFFRTISSFKHDGVNYSYFGFVQEVDTDKFFIHPATGEKVYHINLPDWMPNESHFPTEEPSYIVLLEDVDTIIPEELFQQIDALVIHYMENEESLIVAHQRAEALSEARKKLESEAPEIKPEVIINYWPIKSNADL